MPKEYIEREALLADIDKNVILPEGTPHLSKEVKGAHNVMCRIRLAPAADVVEVVRCGECRFAEPMTETEKRIFLNECVACSQMCHDNSRNIMRPTDYCSYGERRDGADNETD